jgi:hypothetical protein
LPTQLPLPSHVSSIVHASLSSQANVANAKPARTHAPPLHVSRVHTLLSKLHAASLGTCVCAGAVVVDDTPPTTPAQ